MNKKPVLQVSKSKYLPPSYGKIKVERNPNPIEEKLFTLIVLK
jgi:hypothetical protein